MASDYQSSEYSEPMMSYIMNHSSDVSLTDIANHFHFSVPYCSRLVKEFSGLPFSKLITQIRMSQAENLLTHTQMSVADISEQVGYKNPETFIRVFTRIYHLSPTQYRKSPPDTVG